jgi:secreted trypsin-like serine protease
MLTKTFLSIFTLATTPVNPPLDPRYRRVYNPDEMTSVEEYPFMAALLVNNELWCGAVIIDTNAVLTAAHCLQLYVMITFLLNPSFQDSYHIILSHW